MNLGHGKHLARWPLDSGAGLYNTVKCQKLVANDYLDHPTIFSNMYKRKLGAWMKLKIMPGDFLKEMQNIIQNGEKHVAMKDYTTM